MTFDDLGTLILDAAGWIAFAFICAFAVVFTIGGIRELFKPRGWGK